MPIKKSTQQNDTIDLLEKILVFQLFSLGASQGRIAKIIKRQKAWVNDLVKGISKGGISNGKKEKNRKAQKRSQH